jgi:hypothetical protein
VRISIIIVNRLVYINFKCYPDSQKLDVLLSKRKFYTCELCYGDIRYEDDAVIALKPPTPQCDHDRKICKNCLGQIIERVIRGGLLKNLICPDPECQKPITLPTVREHVPSEVFEMSVHLASVHTEF